MLLSPLRVLVRLIEYLVHETHRVLLLLVFIGLRGLSVQGFLNQRLLHEASAHISNIVNSVVVVVDVVAIVVVHHA